MSTEPTPSNGAATPTPVVALTPYQERQIMMREQISQDSVPRAIVPRTFAEAQAFATALAHSSLIPDALRDRGPDILMIVLAGSELGIPPIRALTLFHVIEGVPKLSADGLAAIVSANDLCEYLEPIEQSDDRVTWRAKKRGRPEQQLTVTHMDIERAGLLRPARSGAPSNHVKYPRQMKNARCKAELAKLVWPEVCSGLVTAEEARDALYVRELEQLPATSTMVAPPAPAPLPAPSSTPARPKASKAAAPKPIDVASTTPSPPAPTTKALPPDAARDEALRKAGDAGRELEQSRQRNEEDGNSFDPTIPATTEDRGPEGAMDVVTPDAGSDASDGFGDDDTADVPRIEAFEAGLADIVKRKAVNELGAYKAQWVPWSKIDGAAGGKAHAHKMRDLFAQASAALGVR